MSKGTETESLKKQLANAEAVQAKHTRLRDEASAALADLENKNRGLLKDLAGGDEGVRRDLASLESKKAHANQSIAAHAAQLEETGASIRGLREGLRRSQQQDVITDLSREIERLAPLDSELEQALALVKEKSSALFAAASAVGQELQRLDASRWENCAYELTSTITLAIRHRIEELSLPTATAPRLSFMARVQVRLRSAIAQLAFESLEGAITPAKGEQLFRTTQRLSGVRCLDLKPGALIALTADEAEPFVESGVLVAEPAAA